MSSPGPLISITGDGTFGPTTAAEGARPADVGSRLEALTALRSLLGDDLEEQISTELYLPAALGTESADHLLPASLALLAGTTGDLASYGWRVGPGAGLSWQRASELRRRTIEDSRFALLGYEGPLRAVTLGPVTLAAATHLASGERTLADRGAVRDLPILLAEGITEHVAAMREAVPGADPRILLREDAARSVHGGLITAPSGYRRYPALPAQELGDLWRSLIQSLGASTIASGALRLQIPPLPALLDAALSAGARSIAVSVARIGPLEDLQSRTVWEALAEARENGIDLALVVDPGEVQATFSVLSSVWRQLGYTDRDLAGLTLIAHRTGAARPVHGARRPDAEVSASTGRSTLRSAYSAVDDPGAEPSRSSLLTEADLQRVLRSAPAWAERLGS